MYSKKILREALMQEPPENAKWALFPMTLNNNEESLAIWIVPQKLRLLRLLGMEYELHRKKDAPALIRAEMKGLVVERVKTDLVSKFYYNGKTFYDTPEVSNPAFKPYALVGLRDCKICVSKEIGVEIGLQHFIEETIFEGCPSVLNWQTESIFKELCSIYCHTNELIAEYVTPENSQYFTSYHIILPPEFGLMEWAKEKGACRELERFARKQLHAPQTNDDYDQYEFRLSVNFGQVEKDYSLAFIRAEAWGNGGRIELDRSLGEFNSQDTFLGLVENSLRKALPFKMEGRLTDLPNTSLAEVEKFFENLDDEEKLALDMPVADALVAALADVGRDDERKAERWKNIMEA